MNNMQSRQLSSILALVLTAAFHGFVAGQDSITPGTADPFVGTWVIDTVNGEKVEAAENGLREILMLNGTHFFYGRMHDDTVDQIMHGGSYRIVNGKFTESIEFHPKNNREVGNSYTFDVSIRDGKLIKSGQLRGKQLNQVWQRFEPSIVLSQSGTEWEPIPVRGLDDWSDPGQWWSEKNGIVFAESKGGEGLPKWHYLLWNGSLSGDFELQLDYRILATAPQDAGVCFRVARSAGINENGNLAGYQAELDTAIQFADQTTKKNEIRFIRQGLLFGHIHDGKRQRMFKRNQTTTIDEDGKEAKQPFRNKFNPALVYLAPPKWNTCRIHVEGNRIRLYLNNVMANEIIDAGKERSQGNAIALQFRPNKPYTFEVKDIKYRIIDNN